MQAEIIVSGFGGQGVLFAGQLMAHCALDNQMEVTWFPSYGPEMRGGTAHCTVIVADEEIGSPIIRNPTAAIVMNLPSLDKYEPLVAREGVLIINSSLVDRSAQRDDLSIVEVPANEIAEEIGDRRMANLVMVGALLNRLPIFTIEQLSGALERHMPERHRELLDANLKALEQGYQIGEGSAVAV
jgi:2-oxoglutarate ferredoxin oxidoreductase subunit gamma